MASSSTPGPAPFRSGDTVCARCSYATARVATSDGPVPHCRVDGRRTCFETIDEMLAALNKYVVAYNRKRPHQGRRMNGRTPWQAFQEGLPRRPKTNRRAEQEERKAA